MMKPASQGDTDLVTSDPIEAIERQKQMRKQERSRIANRVKQIYEGQSFDDTVQEPVGCLSVIGRRARRMFGCVPVQFSSVEASPARHSESGVVGETSASSAAQKGAQRSAMSVALFGKRRGEAASTPTQRLQMAQQSIDERCQALEMRAEASRKEAATLVTSGNKAGAMRALKRSKQLQSQASNLANASMAIERQSDMLEEAGLQQEVAKALQAGVKDMKKVQNAMKTVESISDTAITMCDDVEEINTLLSQLVNTGDAATIDEDDLLAELESMSQEAGAADVTVADPSQASTPTPLGSELAATTGESVAHLEFPTVPHQTDLSQDSASSKQMERAQLLSDS